LELLNRVNNIRNYQWHHKQLDWDGQVTQLLHKGVVKNEYGMEISSQRKRICILDLILQRKEYSSHSDKPILFAHVVVNGL
jgi:hypothetical protein